MAKRRTRRERGLTARELAFVDAYVELGVGVEAAIKAGYTKNRGSARAQACELLQRPLVVAAVAQARGELSQRTKLDAEWIERRLMALADTAPTPGAQVRALELLGKRLGLFIDRVEVTEKLTDDQRKSRLLALIETGRARAKAAERPGAPDAPAATDGPSEGQS